MLKGKEAYIIYFWQGGKSSTDEKAASALLSRQIDDELGGAPVQVRRSLIVPRVFNHSVAYILYMYVCVVEWMDSILIHIMVNSVCVVDLIVFIWCVDVLRFA